MDTLYTEFGKILKQKRSQVNLTQEDLAARIKLGRTSVTNIEKGRQQVSLEVLYDLARALGVEPKDLLPDNTPLGSLSPVMESEVSEFDPEIQPDIRKFLYSSVRP